MSRQNKVNPDHYTIAGRLSPDDLARERWKPIASHGGRVGRRDRKPLPPWMVNDQAHAAPTEPGLTGDVEQTAAERGARQTKPPAEKPKPKPRKPSRAATEKRAPVRAAAKKPSTKRRVAKKIVARKAARSTTNTKKR